ncbi:Histone-Lysine N-Methyltransferase ash1l, partial [Phlyctochytrium bullatum]
MFIECTPGFCPCGENCSNQVFQKSDNDALEVFWTEARGYGLRTKAPIPRNSLVIEYRGEVISQSMCIDRMNTVYREIDNYYFLNYDTGEVLDACQKGTEARFVNHSCEPNCHIEKWSVMGEFCVGLFASNDIPAGVELTYDYRFQSFGPMQRCLCGSPNCRGFIGVNKKKESKEAKQPEKKVKKKRGRKKRQSTAAASTSSTSNHAEADSDDEDDDFAWYSGGPARRSKTIGALMAAEGGSGYGTGVRVGPGACFMRRSFTRGAGKEAATARKVGGMSIEEVVEGLTAALEERLKAEEESEESDPSSAEAKAPVHGELDEAGRVDSEDSTETDGGSASREPTFDEDNISQVADNDNEMVADALPSSASAVASVHVKDVENEELSPIVDGDKTPTTETEANEGPAADHSTDEDV